MRVNIGRSFKAGLTALVVTGVMLIAAPSTGAATPKPGPSSTPANPASGVTQNYDWKNAKVPPTREQLQRGVDEVLQRMPGARQIDAFTIDLGGAFMKFDYPALQSPKTNTDATANEAVQPLESGGCPQYYLCVFAHADFVHPTLQFYACGREWNLGNVAYPGGGFWNDKISSITNPQSSGTWSYFYNYISYNNWSRLLSLQAGHYLKNLAWDTSEDGSGSPNDRIDGVHVCGAVPSPWTPNWP